MIKVNGKSYETHVEAMNELKIDKKHIRKIREGLAKHGKVEIGKHTFVGTISPKKARATKVAHGSKKVTAKKGKKTATKAAKRSRAASKKPAAATATPAATTTAAA